MSNVPTKSASQRAAHRQRVAVRRDGMSYLPSGRHSVSNTTGGMRKGKTERDRMTGAHSNHESNVAERRHLNKTKTTKGKK